MLEKNAYFVVRCSWCLQTLISSLFGSYVSHLSITTMGELGKLAYRGKKVVWVFVWFGPSVLKAPVQDWVDSLPGALVDTLIAPAGSVCWNKLLITTPRSKREQGIGQGPIIPFVAISPGI